MAKPNVVFIVAAQHRWDCCGFTGHPDVRTPNLDALAQHGIVFSNAVTPFPQSAPARASLLTGLYPSRHGVVHETGSLLGSVETLPRMLRRQGYYTGAVGMLDSHPVRSDLGFDITRLAEQTVPGRNQDDYHGYLQGQGLVDIIDEWEHVRRRSAPDMFRETLGAMRSTLPQHMHSTAWIGDQAVRFIQGAPDPFFLWVGFIKPRPPFDPPPPWDGVYNPRAVTLPRGWRHPVDVDDSLTGHSVDPRLITEARFRRVAAFYYANISYIDKQVGRILATLAGRGITNTLIVYTADHGDYMGQHGLIGRHPALLYDSLIRVPFIVSGLAGQRQGAVDDGAVTLADLAPTVLDAAGKSPGTSLDGRSLHARMANGSALLREIALVEGDGPALAARSRAFKVVDGPADRQKMVFRLDSDPDETDNLYGRVDGPGHAALRAAMDQHQNRLP